MNNNLKIDVDGLMDIRDTRKLALTVMTIEPVINTMEIDTMSKLNKILIQRFVKPIINYKFFDCPNCLKSCTDNQKMQGCTGFLPKRLNQVLIIDEDKLELDTMLKKLANDAAKISRLYEGKEKPIDLDTYMLVRDMVKTILAMNGKLDLFIDKVFGRERIDD